MLLALGWWEKEPARKMKLPIYMDSHATTPCDPRVVEAMLPTFSEQFGNASSRNHVFGWQAEALIDKAREQVAALIHCRPDEIIFTSGATESDNLALKGTAHLYAPPRRAIVTCATEHRAVLDSCRRLEREGFPLTLLPVGRDGLIRLADLAAAIGTDTILVSIMAANNEVGVVQPVREIGQLCKEKGVFFHCDAVQALSCERLDVQELGIDLLSISAHKMYGPKGVGALYVRRHNPRVRLEPLLNGGGHERGLRSGTLNVPGIVGLGQAAELAAAERDADAARMRVLRDRLLERILTGAPEAIVHGSMERRLPNNLNVSFPGLASAALMAAMPGVAIGAGAACASATLEPSHVLRAMGVSPALAEGSLRFGLHRFTTVEEVDYVAAEVIRAATRLGLTPADAPVQDYECSA